MITYTLKTMFYTTVICSIASCTLFSQSTQITQEYLHDLVQKSLVHEEKERLSFILQELHTSYNTPLQPRFLLFNGGGAFGLLAILYASATEYLAIYGTPLCNGGHSGRYLFNVSDFIFRGQVTIASPQEPEGRIVPAGDKTYMAWGDAHHYTLEKNTWMIEYAQGFVPSALPFMLVGLSTTGDFIGAGLLFYEYGKATTTTYLNKLLSFFTAYETDAA